MAPGHEDPEHPDQRFSSSALSLQHRLCSIVDSSIAHGLAHWLTSAGQWEDVRRIRELSDTSVDNTWLWLLNAHKGPVLAENDFTTAVRLRLGSAGPDEPIICANCGGVFGPTGAHALLCACGPSTAGHNHLRDTIHSFAIAVDPSATLEVPGLIPSHPALRPADIFTSAASRRQAALDVGVVSPDAQGAGDDCVEAMHERKLRRYAPHMRELERGGIDYVPLVWSAYGRAHPRATTFTRLLAHRIARRRGSSDWQGIWRRMMSCVSVAIWQRAARMVHQCWPRHNVEAERPIDKSAERGARLAALERARHPGHASGQFDSGLAPTAPDSNTEGVVAVGGAGAGAGGEGIRDVGEGMSDGAEQRGVANGAARAFAARATNLLVGPDI